MNKQKLHLILCLSIFSRCLCGFEVETPREATGPIENLITFSEQAIPSRSPGFSQIQEYQNGKLVPVAPNAYAVAPKATSLSLGELSKPQATDEMEKDLQALLAQTKTLPPSQAEFESVRRQVSDFITKYKDQLEQLATTNLRFAEDAQKLLSGFYYEDRLRSAIAQAKANGVTTSNSNSGKPPVHQTSH